MKPEPATKFQMVMDLMVTAVYDEDGNFVKYEPTRLISIEKAKELLGFKDED